jgi:8-oxo-dGTP diphosphatase
MAQELIRPILTVDVVILTLHQGRVQVVLQERAKPPHAARLAVVGGYVHPEEDSSTTAAAARMLKSKTGLTARVLEQLMTFSGPDRDARGWSASVAYCALLPGEALQKRADPSLKVFPFERVKGLPFDHGEIVAKAVNRCRRRGVYSTLPAFLLEPTFTLSSLRLAYEAVLGRTLNDSAFRRKIDELRVIEPVVGAASKATARPAQLYRLSRNQVTEFDRTI